MRMNVKVDNEEGSYSVFGITFILYNGFVTTCYTGYNHTYMYIILVLHFIMSGLVLITLIMYMLICIPVIAISHFLIYFLYLLVFTSPYISILSSLYKMNSQSTM